MEIKSCSNCGRAFAYDDNDLCPKCRFDDDDAEFRKVKEYLYDNPGADIKEVSDETEVSTKKILQFLKDERITIAEGSENTALACERCSVAINMGKYCNKCINEMKQEFTNAIKKDEKKEEKGIEFKSKPKRQDSEGMFVADRYKDD